MMRGNRSRESSLSSGEQVGWFLHSGGRRFGPLAEDELRNYFRAGMVKSVDRISAPGQVKMRAAGEVALELGETVPEGPPPPEPASTAPVPPTPDTPATPVIPAAPPATLDPAAEAERQERVARAIAAMKVDLAGLGAQPRTQKTSGWLVPVVLVVGLVVAMFVGLHMLKKMSAQATRTNAGAEAPVPMPMATPRLPEIPPALIQPQVPQELQQAKDYASVRNWTGLAALAKSWTQTQPDRVEAWQYLGMAHFGLGDSQAATDAFARALALDPSNAQTRALLADAYLQGGRYAESVGLYEKVVAASPNDARVWNNYGTALIGTGQSTQAIAALQTAVRLDPGFKPAWKNLGSAYRNIGDESRASAAFANAR